MSDVNKIPEGRDVYKRQLLYYVWRKRYQIEGQKGLTIAVYALSAVRIVLCMMPQNQWLTNHTPLTDVYKRQRLA